MRQSEFQTALAFVRYSRQDVAEELEAKSKHAGLPNSKVYFDENALKVGDQYNKELALQQLTKANAPPWSERGYLADMGRDLGSALP